MLAGLCSASISTIFREINLFLQQYIRCQSKKINRLSKKRDCHILHEAFQDVGAFSDSPFTSPLPKSTGTVLIRLPLCLFHLNTGE